ncbi:helix-turn-helix transcriptional regulator [Fusobacterium varium]|uniref:YafY family transcriptional regulator n=1 Tax=Fusobacterium varium ATCC 27725 TaxID=469618 RepID=A0ABM6U1B0_FUSVA|nr:YafY family protein [Fusobacterium varium]AVQ30060.1 YafY family transcriptional regulator [Fusobacterium varium ATCC 27725]EES64919.1 HTH domain protein [Fusobacterium varium ATCC 27725]RGJ22072.1 YafY family transcriptional regulator [Fusobacterium varium]
MKIDRLLSIIMVLIEQNKISASKLAEMFEVTPRTIYRDIETIQAAGVPIVTYTGTNGGIGILENYKIDKKFFTKEDMITIMTGLGSISSSVTNSGLNKVLTKLQSLIPEDHTQEIKLKSGQVVIDLTTWSGNKKLQANLIKIKEALNQRRYLIFKYLDGNGKSTERKVEPYQLLWKEEKWYINSYCTMRNDFRLFKLSRISYLKVLDETFSLREFDMEELRMNWSEKRILNIKLLADVSLKEKILERCEEENITYCGKNKMIVEFPFVDDDFGYELLLSFGNKCECLEPIEIREKLIEKIRNMLHIYN